MGSKAVFLDRDGTIVSLVYDKETGYIDSITRPEQVRIMPKAPEALLRLKQAGYKLILVSNQPAVAKGRVDEATFWEAAFMTLRTLFFQTRMLLILKTSRTKCLSREFKQKLV